MHDYDKAKIIRDKHIAVHIEWGGVDGMFTHASDLSMEGLVDFVRILQYNDEREIRNYLEVLIDKEYERNNK